MLLSIFQPGPLVPRLSTQVVGLRLACRTWALQAHPAAGLRSIHLRPSAIRRASKAKPPSPSSENPKKPNPTDGEKAKPTSRPKFDPIYNLKDNLSYLRSVWTWENAKKRPYLLAFLIVLFAWPIVYLIWFSIWAFYSEYLCRYPEPIASSLRNAIWFSKWYPNAKLAAKHWAQALQQCSDMKLDILSDEVMGIRIEAVAWLESIGQLQMAIVNLNRLKSDLSFWLEAFDRNRRAGHITDDGRWRKEPPPDFKTDVVGEDLNEEDIAHLPENLWHRRDHLLRRILQVSVKLADIYSSLEEPDHDKAMTELEFVMETALTDMRAIHESEKRDKDLEGPLPAVELGAVFERLAIQFMHREKYELAMPLLLQALPLSTEPCTSATVMENIAVNFFHFSKNPDGLVDDPVVQGVLKSQTPAPTKSNPNPEPPPVQKALRRAARNWANNALKLATETLAKGKLGEDDRNKCALCCMMANLSLGEIEESAENYKKATKKYKLLLREKGVGGIDIIGDVFTDEAWNAFSRAKRGLERVKKLEAGEVPGAWLESVRRKPPREYTIEDIEKSM